MLGIYRRYFPESGDIEALEVKIYDTFCGVRVLPKQAGQAFERSRELWLQSRESHPRFLTLYGGKLTTFRSTAKEVTHWLHERLGERVEIADVDRLPLY